MTTDTIPAADALTEIAERPLILDEYPVNDGDLTVNVWIREADELATMRMTREDEDDEGNAETIEIDAYLNTDDLFHLAMTGGQALAKLGDRANLIELIQGLVDLLGEMK